MFLPAMLTQIKSILNLFSTFCRGYISEKIYEYPMDPELTVASILAIPLTQLAKKTPEIIHPFVNTYTYTKNLAERAIEKLRGDIPVLIVRPSIIIAAQDDPYTGWLDAMTAAAPLSTMLCTGHINFLCTSSGVKSDLIPVDLVSSTIIVGTAFQMNKNNLKVMHSSTSHLNPTTWENYSLTILEFAKASPFKNQVGPLSFNMYTPLQADVRTRPKI